MNQPRIVSELEQICCDHPSHIRALECAKTHPSMAATLADKSLHRALVWLGKTGIETVLCRQYVRLHRGTSCKVLSSCAQKFNASSQWVDQVMNDEMLSTISFGKGSSAAMLSDGARRRLLFALIGAGVIADLEKAANLIVSCFSSLFASSSEHGVGSDPKSVLQAITQLDLHVMPTYRIRGEHGPDHERTFECEVVVNGITSVYLGRGLSKKAAEVDAARTMLNDDPRIRRSSVFAKSTAKSSVLRESDWSVNAWLRCPKQNVVNYPVVDEFVQFLRHELDVEFSTQLALVCMTPAKNRDAIGCPASTDVGLPALGARIYQLSLLRVLFSSCISNSPTSSQPEEFLIKMTRPLQSNAVKEQIAAGWLPFANWAIGDSTPRWLTDTFESSLAAAAVLDIRNISAIERFLGRFIADHYSEEAGFSETITKIDRRISRTQSLQELCQRFSVDGFREALENGFEYHFVGPVHSCTYSCQPIGDVENYFVGKGASKKEAKAASCQRIVRFVCESVAPIDAKQSSVRWIWNAVRAMQQELLLNPSMLGWNIDFLTYPFPHPGVWIAIAEVVKTPSAPALCRASRIISGFQSLTETHKSSLLQYLCNAYRDRIELVSTRVIEHAIKDLLTAYECSTAETAIAVLTSSLYLMKLSEPEDWRPVRLVQVVGSAQNLLFSDGDASFRVPERVTYAANEAILNVLRIVQVSGCLGPSAEFSVTPSDGEVTIIIPIRNTESPARRVLNLALSLLIDDMQGFSVLQTDTSCEMRLRIAEFAIVSNNSWASDLLPLQMPLKWKKTPDFEAIMTALHDIKNRILMSPTNWIDELSVCVSGVSEVAKLLMTPDPRAVDLRGFVDSIETLCRNVGGACGIAPTLDILCDEETGYIDVPILLSCIQNLIDNAGAACKETEHGRWGVQGLVTTHDVELLIWNTCANGSDSLKRIEAGLASDLRRSSTGIGVGSVKRLFRKMLGEIDFGCTDSEVRVRAILPIDIERALWLAFDESA